MEWKGWWEGSAGKDACCQAQWPESNPGIYTVEGKNQPCMLSSYLHMCGIALQNK